MTLSLDHIQLTIPASGEPKAHLGFNTDDIKTLATRLTDANRPLAWDTTLKNRQRFFSQDPFGNQLDFLQLF